MKSESKELVMSDVDSDMDDAVKKEESSEDDS